MQIIVTIEGDHKTYTEARLFINLQRWPQKQVKEDPWTLLQGSSSSAMFK